MIGVDFSIYYAYKDLQWNVCLLENSLVGPRLGAVAAKIGCKMGQKIGSGLWKKGAKNAPQNYFPPFTSPCFKISLAVTKIFHSCYSGILCK